MKQRRTPMKITAWHDPVRNETLINIVVTDEYLRHAEPAEHNVSHLIDMPQFFGMLEDVVCRKWGLELPKTNDRGHNG